jgi:signal transduction histidine kinase
MLEGIDKGFTTSGNPVIIYPSLPPGRYTLLVRGVTKSGFNSVNVIRYPFEIKKAFYQTSFFQALIIFILISTGALITWVVTRTRQKRKQKAKELMTKIREEEFKKLRQRTAEDFHDEMGNSLTRISILTDILKSRINGHDEDVTRLVQQIKENTTALYNGSRDIIWSLNSQNDGIYEIAEHIKEIGHDVFGETPIEFSCSHNITPRNPLKLKLDYSRNLTMIFKEAYSNILRHAGARRVEISMELKNGNELEISVKDDGTGFDLQQKNSGNGIRNMQNRVQRMHGEFNLQAVPGSGTGIHIRLNSVFVN